MNKQEMREFQEREAQREEWTPRLPVISSDMLHLVMQGAQPPSLDGLPQWLAQDELIRRGAT